MLVTGAAGFVGARFVARCNQSEIPVISVDAPQYFRERTEHAGIDFGTIVDRELLLDQLARAPLPMRAIIHLGACTDTTEYDVEYLKRVNLEYSQALWTFATKHAIPFVYASSAATYGEGEKGYVDDESKMHALVPLNPYGDSKLQFDLWVLEEEKAGRTPPTWSGFKFFNVYGFGERHKRKMASVVVAAFDQILEKGRVRLFKSHREGIEHGHQARDFIYVRDVVDVLFFALDKPLRRGIYNLGTGEARTFEDLAKATFRALGREPDIEYFDTPLELRERYQYFTQADMKKLRRAGYMHPFTSLEDGVHAYVQKLLAARG
ncbi:MAG: ADP-glyceromanno-heptose 6-epimerase [Planctomycetes bacterium]|nr:ADP-glyceromanno-heptose 6-epimerase [Planctomycetota bacterium]